VTYVFMARHYPELDRRADLYRRMADMAESIHGAPGLIESREAFEAAMPGSGVPSDTIHEWEARPREYMHLTQPAR
jgi:hypothetical protein